MKKAILYILFFVLLLNQTSLNQLFKVPALVAHFLEHHGVDHNMDVVTFLSMHYWGQDINDNDQEKDMKLPFKKVDKYSSFSIAIPVAKMTIEKQQHSLFAATSAGAQTSHISNPALASLFRPPRLLA